MLTFYLGGFITLAFLGGTLYAAYRLGWLEKLAGAVFDVGGTRSKRALLKYLAQGRSLRAQLYEYNRKAAFGAVIPDQLNRLTYEDAIQVANDIQAMAVDLQLQAKETLDFAQRSTAGILKGQTSPLSRTPSYVDEPKKEKTSGRANGQNGYVRQPDFNKFNPRETYGVVKKNQSAFVEMSGETLNDLLRQGLIDGVDFFVLPAELLSEL